MLGGTQIVEAGSKVVTVSGFSNTAIFDVQDNKKYFAIATNGDWNAGEVNIIGTLYYNNQIHIRLDKEYSGGVRVNYAIFKID